MSKRFRARRCAITFWSPPDFKEDEGIHYFLSAEEICPDTKKVHYQSYIEFSKQLSLTAIKKLINDDKANILKCKGNTQQNIEYCKKGEQTKEEWTRLRSKGPNYGKNLKLYREFGTPKQQGKRTDILELRDHFKQGKRLRDAVLDDSMCRTVAKHPKFARMVELMFSKPRSEMTELYIYWGVTGAGKSHKAQADAGPDAYYKPLGKDSQWWDGYEQNESIIIEDFRGEIPLSTLLRLADKYPMRVPVKGGYCNFDSRKIYITSNIDIHEWFNTSQKGYDASMAALKRRITKKVHFDLPFNKK